MIEIDRFRRNDRPLLDQLFRRVLGAERADALGRRWDWLYLDNPNLPDDGPLIWLAREGDAIVGQYATMPVRLQVHGAEIGAAWGTDVMVAPEGQRKGLGHRLFETWDRNVGASIGLGLTDSSYGLFRKLQWPDLGRVPRFVKRLTPTALEVLGERSRARGSALTLPWRRLAATLRPLGGDVRRVHEFDAGFTRLWERVASRFAFAVRRDAPYLNWKYLRVPHLKYAAAALMKGGDVAGYVLYRHVVEPEGRTMLLVDFLADPADPGAMTPLLRWIEREAHEARSDGIRVYTTHRDFQASFRAAGYDVGPPGMRFVAKINAVSVPPTFYDSCDAWHVTLGDSDADR